MMYHRVHGCIVSVKLKLFGLVTKMENSELELWF